MAHPFPLLLCCCWLGLPVPSQLSAQSLRFNQQIKPILSDRCFVCHGPDEGQRATELRFDQAEGLQSIIVAGDPDASELIQRIEAEDESLRMPPAHAKMSLTQAEIQLMRDWIREGAPWEPHWSFAPIEAALPPATLPAEAQHPIDRFLKAKLENTGRKFSEPASPETRLRRVTFDLTGVSPTLEELDQFLADPSPQTYEVAVDRLLASPRFGERLASIWLDLARYSDSFGYQVDRERMVWPWRDWVVRSFNSNLPYDQFAIHQIAGDLLPNATQDQILATAFNRLHPQKVEGGSIEEEFRVEYVADRVHALGTAFLGLTVECARCHDHKFDPISMDEYYQLFAFFNQLDESGLYSFFDAEAVPTPTLMLLDPTLETQLQSLTQSLLEQEQLLADLQRNPELEARFMKWLHAADQRVSVFENQLDQFAARLNLKLDTIGPNQAFDTEEGFPAIRLTGDDEIQLEGGRFPREHPFSVFARIKIPETTDPIDRNVLLHCSGAWTDSASRGYQLLIENGKLSAALIHFWPGNAIAVQTLENLPTGNWIDIALCYDGSSRAAGIQLFVNGQPQPVEIVRDHLTRRILGSGTDHLKLGARFRDRGFKDGQLAAVGHFDRELSSLEVAQLHNHQALVETLAKPVATLTPGELASLREYYVARIDPPSLEARERLKEARRALNQFHDQQREIMVMRESPGIRKTFRLARGAYDAPANEVLPDVPAIFPPLAAEPLTRSPNRLDLANWLVRRDNPLAARVAVNQYWQMLFGVGLVRTPEDFGSQSQPPLQQELLDWLADDFRRDWDIKRCLKQIVMSAAYQQTSVVTPGQLEQDPENLWFARQSAHRLSAEMVRDHVLLQSGLLSEDLGGPPVRPYDLELAFSPLQRGQGKSLYRRSLYTFWKRTSTSPAMIVLDAPSRDVCTVRRERTSSPLQGLLLLNGTQFVEAARKLSERMLDLHGSAPTKIASDLFRCLTSRHPTPEETQVLQRLFEQQQQRYSANPQLTEALLTVGDAKSTLEDRAELAAWTTVASVILNYEESAFRR